MRKDHPSPDEMRLDVQSKEVSLEDAKQWASERLLANRIGEARAVMSLVIQSQENQTDDLQTRLLDRNLKMSEWEYKTAIKNGNLGLGISLHGMFNGYRKSAGLEEHLITPEEYQECGKHCVLSEDWHNAIASFERGKNKADLIELAHRLQDSNDLSEQRYAELAQKVADALK